jgi:hypothetical protein
MINNVKGSYQSTNENTQQYLGGSSAYRFIHSVGENNVHTPEAKQYMVQNYSGRGLVDG